MMNQAKKISRFLSTISNSIFKLYNVLSLTNLHTSEIAVGKIKSFINIIKIKGPKTEP